MKSIEYYYNLIYYFFYRGSNKIFYFIDILVSPLMNFLFFLSEFFPSTQKVYDKKGIKNPKKYYKDKMKNTRENPTLSLGTIYGHGFAAMSLASIFMGIYKILKNLLLPYYQDNFAYLIIIFAILAYSLDIYFTQTGDKDVYYIDKFNKIKDKSWRRKWAFITALTFPLSIIFMVLTSKSSYIGGFFFELHQYLF